MRAVQVVMFLVATLLCVLIAMHGLQYLAYGEGVMPDRSASSAIEWARMEITTPIGRYRELITGAMAPLLLAHAVGGALALLAMPLHVLSKSLKLDINLQHTSLVVYAAGVALSSVAGLAMAPTAWGGLPARIGFVMMALAWMFTLWHAVVSFLKEDDKAHHEWLMRNMSLTFAGVTLRIWVPVFLGVGVPFEAAYAFCAWFAWVPNFALVEIWIRGTPHDPRAYIPAK